MSNVAIRALLWCVLFAHLTAGVLSWRRGSALPLLPLINFATAAAVVAYWMQRWYGVLVRGITWHGTDQLLPLYALAVCIFSGVALAGKGGAAGPVHWSIFTLHLLVVIAATLFFTFVKITRMI